VARLGFAHTFARAGTGLLLRPADWIRGSLVTFTPPKLLAALIDLVHLASAAVVAVVPWWLRGHYRNAGNTTWIRRTPLPYPKFDTGLSPH
jgi:hypothetical protein